MRYSHELTAISDWCQRYRIPCADIDTAMHRFDAYLKLLLHYQKRTNLIGCESVSQIVEDLFIDSLQILRTGDLGANAFDIAKSTDAKSQFSIFALCTMTVENPSSRQTHCKKA